MVKLNQKGAVQLLPILFIIGIVGIIVFLLISSTAPFGSGLFGKIASKPSAFAKSSNGWKNYNELVSSGQIKPAGKILEVNLAYDASASSKIAIINTKIKNGYAPQMPIQSGSYELDLSNAQNQVVFAQPFNIPNRLDNPPPMPGTHTPATIFTLSKLNVTVTVPYKPTYTLAEVIDKNGNVVASSQISPTSQVNNTPHFYTISGDQLLNMHKTQGFLNNVIKTAYAQSSGANNNLLDITFIGNGYTDMTQFHNDVNADSAHMLTYEPYKTRASQIAFHYVDNTTNLNCSISGRLDVCDGSLATQIVNNAGVPWDTIFIIDNTSTYAGSGTFGGVGVAYNGSYGPPMFVHESGHALVYLTDEYALGYNEPNYTNCYSGTPPNPAWQGYVSNNSYFLGCDFSNWYRSSNTSVMYSLDSSSQFFNAASQIYVNQTLDQYAGPFNSTSTSPSPSATVSSSPTPVPTQSPLPTPTSSPSPVGVVDTTPPSVSITEPVNGSTVQRGSYLQLQASASDNVGVTKVQIFVNGNNVCNLTMAPYNCSYKLPGKKNTQYSVWATAYDAALNSATSSVVKVTAQ